LSFESSFSNGRMTCKPFPSRIRLLAVLVRAVVLCGLAERQAWATAAGWNCQQDARTREWVCIAGKQQEVAGTDESVEETPSTVVNNNRPGPAAAAPSAVAGTAPAVVAPAPSEIPAADVLPPDGTNVPETASRQINPPVYPADEVLQQEPVASMNATAEPAAPIATGVPVASPEPLPPLFDPPPVVVASEAVPAVPVTTGTAVASDAAEGVAVAKPETLPPLFEAPLTAAAGSVAVSVPRVQPDIAMIRMPGNRAPEIKEDPAHSAQRQDEVEAPGWACHADATTQEWICDLRGADPGGALHKVTEPGEEPDARWAESNEITDQDELRLSQLLTRMPADPWDFSCKRPRTQNTPASVFIMSQEDDLLRQRSPLEIDADKAELIEAELSNYSGDAFLHRADQTLYADFVSYNNKTANANAQGNVFYREKGTAFASTTSFMRMNSDQSVLRNAQYILETIPARGTARVAYLDSKTLQRYENVTLTGCPVGNQDWVAHADTAHVDKEANEAVLRNAWLEFKGVPFAWTPYYSFPLDDRRKSGLLAPAIGYNKMNGLGYIQPYYLDLAPNYDATLTFREQTTRGQAGRGQFRYLTDYAQGIVEGEIMPHDQLAQSEGLASSSRWVFNANNTSQLTDRLSSQAQIFRVSDQRYFQDFGNYLTLATATSYARSFGNLNYRGDGYSVTGVADTYQQINSYVAPGALYSVPYSRLPQLTINTNHPLGDTGLMLSSATDAVNFMNSTQVTVNGGSTAQTVTTGNRLNIRPTLSYVYSTPSAYVKPKLALQYTQYWLTNAQTWNEGNPVSISRTAPIFSVDNGLFLDREFDLGDMPIQQTLEPRLFYLYIPRINQDNIPIFDSSSYDVNYWQLFRENRFVGTDRLADSNQFTLALTSRFIDRETGFNRLTLRMGQIYYLENQTVQMNSPGQAQSTAGYGIATRKYSNLIGEVSSQITSDWSVNAGMQWDPSPGTATIVCAPSTNTGAVNPLYPGKDLSIPRVQGGLRYNNRRNDLLNIGYIYLGNPNCGTQLQTNQSEISFRLPLFDNWHLLGEWAYAINYNATAQTYVGFDKENCCWRFSVLYWQYLNGTASTTSTSATTTCTSTNTTNCIPQTGWSVFINITFKGLTELDTGLDNFLFQRMPGFRRESEL
jgi:LPS-assembly protein